MTKPPLRVFETQNFKAIRASGKIKFDWLTCFIGNNGVGKSSLIEALETFRDVVGKDLDKAMRRWRGFEHVWNRCPDRTVISAYAKKPSESLSREEYSQEKKKYLEALTELERFSDPMRFMMDWTWNSHSYKVLQSISQGPGGNSVFITEESYVHKSKSGTERMSRDSNGKANYDSDGPKDNEGFKDFVVKQKLGPGVSLLALDDMDDWQFLRLRIAASRLSR